MWNTVVDLPTGVNRRYKYTPMGMTLAEKPCVICVILSGRRYTLSATPRENVAQLGSDARIIL